MELSAVRVEIVSVGTNAVAERAQYERDKKYWADQIEAEKKAYELAQMRLDIAQKEFTLEHEKRAFFEDSYNVCMSNKKTSKSCWFKKHVLFLWPWRCK